MSRTVVIIIALFLFPIIGLALGFVGHQRTASTRSHNLSVGSFEECAPVAPVSGNYEQEEETITKRGKLEEELMKNSCSPLLFNEAKVKVVNAGGGLGGGSASKRGSYASLKAMGNAYAKQLQEEGVIRIDQVLSRDNIREYAFELRKEATKEVKSGRLSPKQRFANVLLKKNRCDLTMPLNNIIYGGLHDVLCLSPVGAVFEKLLGKDAVLYELSCIISDPGSDRQVIHPDTPCNENNAVLYTCFIALQDIEMDMGPTVWLPKTNTQEAHEIWRPKTRTAHEIFNSDTACAPDARDDFLQTRPAVLGLLKKGDCAIFDSRLLHCGSANRSETTRALFYFSFKNAKIGYPGNPASIRPELANKLRLKSLTKELDSVESGKGSKQLDSLAVMLK
jgi:ectoine hydroxylase-related dioxygenase (phytanoyl-CoA dioxygenase family)